MNHIYKPFLAGIIAGVKTPSTHVVVKVVLVTVPLASACSVR